MKLKAASGIMLTLLFIGMLTLAFNIQPVKASGTIYIMADGSIQPPTANITSTDNVTYTFTDNIYDSIVVERDNIVVDGGGYTVQGTGNIGIDLSYRNNVTLKNVEVTNFSIGIYLYNSSNNTLTGNNASSNSNYGICLEYSSNNSLIGNNASNNYVGIRLEYSSDNSLTGNTASNNLNGIYTISSSNSNVLADNTVSSNYYDGIRLISSGKNILTGNNASSNFNGIHLEYSSNNSLTGNNALNNRNGIYLYNSSDNALTGNNASSNNNIGIYLGSSSDNTLTGNNASNSNYGIFLYDSSNNTVFHNNFINNTFEAYVTTGYANTWDNGVEGNYWSDYTGKDLNGDGIGDTPYYIDANNRDRYPLMITYGEDVTKPVANAGPDQTVNVGATVSFDASNSTDNVGIVSYDWNFGDETNGTGKTTTHSYSNSGTYTVTLTVKDAASNNATDTMTVIVRSPETSPQPDFIIWIAIGAVVAIGIAVTAILVSKKRK